MEKWNTISFGCHWIIISYNEHNNKYHTALKVTVMNATKGNENCCFPFLMWAKANGKFLGCSEKYFIVLN